jgi:hypothetical protein
MAGRYFDRLIARARGGASAIRTSPAPRVALDDPFDAPPVAADPVYPVQPRTPARVAPPEDVTRIERVETVAPVPAVEHAPATPLPGAPREVVRHHALERERLVERFVVPPSPVGVPPRGELPRSLAPLVPPLPRMSAERDESPPAKGAPRDVVHTIERVEPRATVAPLPAREPPRPVERVAPLPAPSAAPPLVIAPVAPPVEAVVLPAPGPRLSIGQVIVEVVPRAPERAAAANEPPARIVVTRSAPAPRVGLFQRGFGLGQS